MPSLTRALVPWFVAASVVAPLAAGQAPAQAPAAAARSAAIAPRIDRLVDRVWIVDASTGTPPKGALYVFLSDNTLAVSSAARTPWVGTWAEDVNGLVVTERNVTSKVEVLELTAETLRLRIMPPKGAANEVTLVAAVKPPPPPPQPVMPTTAAAPAAPVPMGIPYQCGADRIRVAMDEGKVYVVWNDGTSTVLRETGGADASPTRRIYSDGQVRLIEDTSESFTRIMFARAGFRPRPCTSAR
ncbi:hypothetical protein [Luteitalea sp. TBR-22]|uniref:hypothetical protein n=1 Tax=Luteitalea sp. TBR-22 TaxID=2802971 RepID=UPI001EF648C1|nr:hypothetical protein [Luteitalea sp. TBR-22]